MKKNGVITLICLFFVFVLVSKAEAEFKFKKIDGYCRDLFEVYEEIDKCYKNETSIPNRIMDRKQKLQEIVSDKCKASALSKKVENFCYLWRNEVKARDNNNADEIKEDLQERLDKHC
ncbi:MAG: hypothetical protein LBB44_02815 [Endomicrobium sp.]|jgi:hypothetical protein|nr:hypothetical protein [Endomicrobium sp.]